MDLSMNAPRVIDKIDLKTAVPYTVEVPSKLPDWLPVLHKNYLEKLKQTTKHPLLVPFRDVLDAEEVASLFGKKTYAKPYENSFIIELDEYFYRLHYDLKTKDSLKTERDAIFSFIHEAFDKKLEYVRNGKIPVGKEEVKIGKFYEKIKAAVGGTTSRYKSFDSFIGKKEWDNRFCSKKDEFDVVFSTNCEDIVGMSARSDWTSCQNIAPGGSSRTDLGRGVLGSFQSKYIGVIYITDRSNHNGRGEKMLYRSVVYLTKSIKDHNKYAFIMARTYPVGCGGSGQAHNIFKKHLSQNIGIPVMEYSETYGLETEDLSYQPYFDTHLPQIYGEEYVLKRLSAGDMSFFSHLPKTSEYFDKYVAKAVKYNYTFIRFAKPSRKDYDKLVDIALKSNTNALQYISPKWSGYDKAINKQIDSGNCDIIRVLNKKHKDYNEIVKRCIDKAFKQNLNLINYIQYINKSYEGYDELITNLVSKSKLNTGSYYYIRYISHTSKCYKEFLYKMLDIFSKPHLDSYYFASMLSSISPKWDGLSDFYIAAYAHKKLRTSVHNALYNRKWSNDIIKRIYNTYDDIDHHFLQTFTCNARSNARSNPLYKDALIKIIKNGKFDYNIVYNLDKKMDEYSDLIDIILKKITPSEYRNIVHHLSKTMKNYNQIMSKICEDHPEYYYKFKSTSPEYKKYAIAFYKDRLNKNDFNPFLLRQGWEEYKDLILYAAIEKKNTNAFCLIKPEWKEFDEIVTQIIKSNKGSLMGFQYTSKVYGKLAEIHFEAHKTLNGISFNWVGFEKFAKEKLRQNPSLLKCFENNTWYYNKYKAFVDTLSKPAPKNKPTTPVVKKAKRVKK